MQNSKIQNKTQSRNTANATSTGKIDGLLEVISQARESLKNWEDKRTEAMIQLDALSYDIVIIEDEKNRVKELNDDLKLEIKRQGEIYQAHVDALTEQMQVLKQEKEAADRRADTHLFAVQEGEAIHQKLEADFKRRSHEMKTEYEARFKSLEQHYQDQTTNLNRQIDQFVMAKQAADQREAQMERELQAIRSQIATVFQVAGADKVYPPATNPTANAKTPTQDANSNSKNRTNHIEIGSPEFATVQDYLKRFGY